MSGDELWWKCVSNHQRNRFLAMGVYEAVRSWEALKNGSFTQCDRSISCGVKEASL
jgi:hypothetical protein